MIDYIKVAVDNSDYINEDGQPWRTGDTRIKDGKKHMLVNAHANYGGGSGPLWATEGKLASITTTESQALVKVRCDRVLADSQALTCTVVSSPYTWGKFCIGQVLVLPIKEIKRYNSYDREIEEGIELPAPINSPHKDMHDIMLREIKEELVELFQKEVHPKLGGFLIEAFDSLNHYRQHYIGPNEVTGIQAADQAKRKFYKSMRKLDRVIHVLATPKE